MLKNSFSKLFAVVLVIIFISSIISACGTDTTIDESKTSSPESVSQTETEVEIIDFGGYEFVLGSHWAEGYFPEEGASLEGDAMLQRYKDIEDTYNVNIVYRPAQPSNFTVDIMQSVMAGDKYADIIESNIHWFQSLRMSDALVPLNMIDSLDLENPKWSKPHLELATFSGNTYGLEFYSWSHRYYDLTHVLFFNKTLLNRYGQPDIYELVRNKEWTWEKFEEISKAVTRDLDGDGKNDVWGVTSIDRIFEWSALWSNDAREIMKDNDGVYKFGLTTSNAYEAIQWASDMINVHGVFRLPPRGSDWREPGLAFRDGHVAFLPYQAMALEWWFKDMEDDFGLAPFPLGPKGSEYTSALHGDLRLWSIISSNPDQDRAAFIFNKITEPFPGDTADSWKNYMRDNLLRDDDSLEMFELMLGNAQPNHTGGFGGPLNQMVQQVFKVTRERSETPASAMEAIREQIQAAIDDFHNSSDY